VIPGKRYTPELVLGLAWRRKWLILIPTVMIAAIACGVIYLLPDQYRSETAILVVPQRVPENYVRSTINTKIEDRLRSINQQVRSRTKLERLIEDFNLYPERRKTDIMQDIVDDMSDAIDVDIVQSDVFRIAFTSDDPRTAMQVTDRLGSFFIDESLKDRTTLAEGTSEFLETQTADAARRLRETEQKIADYKRKFDGELPAQAVVNQQGLNNAQMQLQGVGIQLDRDRELQIGLQRQIQELSSAAEAAAAAPVVMLPDAPLSKAAQVEAMRAQLQALLTTKKPDHPDVTRLQSRMSRLERELAEEAAGQTALDPQATVNPVALRRLKELDTAKEQLESLNRQIERRVAEQRRLQGMIGEYQRRMELAPLHDTQLVELSRDYETLKEQYESLSAKRLESQVSANLERRQIGEQFRILDPARLPEKPTSPNRPMLYWTSLIIALVIGIGAAAGAEYLDQGLRSEDDVRLALALPVLASVPVIGPGKKMSIGKILLAASAAVAVVSAALGTAWFVLR
jgi:polysaccharide chain length determinant protein (PEP-CTERM system associated)